MGLFRIHSSSRSGEKGFSLVEVMLTVVVLTGVALSAMLVVVPVSRQNRISREMDLVNAEARKVLEKIQTAAFESILALYPDKVCLSTTELKGGTATVSYEDPAADPLRIAVTLAWSSQDNGAMSRTFYTVRTR